MDNKYIAAEFHDFVGMITLNNPGTLNAVGENMLHELATQISDFEKNPEVKVIVIRGAEKSFAAGLDIKELATHQEEAKSKLHRMQTDFQALLYAKKPIISLVSGFALGIGCEIALCSDIVLATDNARFGLPELSIFLLPCFGGCRLLSQRVGKAVAADMILTGRALSAEEAERHGLVSRIVPFSALTEESVKITRRLANIPQNLLSTVKRLTNDNTVLSDLFLEQQLSLDCLDSEKFHQVLVNTLSQNVIKA